MENIITDAIVEKFLIKAPELEDYIKQVELQLIPDRAPPFNRLVRSIIYQQLSGKAAQTIYTRFQELVGEITADIILDHSDEDLRSVGLSRQKAGYVKNVARAFTTNGFLSDYQGIEDLDGLTPEELKSLFTQIKGVGEWTVEMYLIFSMGRLDIFSAKDLGVRKGVEIMYELDETPTPGRAKKITSHWSPLQTVGTLLCWRIQD